MLRIALINAHIGRTVVDEALFKVLGYEVVSIMPYYLRFPEAHSELGYKILSKIRRIYRALNKVRAILFKSPYGKPPEYPAPLILYRLLNFLGALKNEDYIAAVVFKSFRYLEGDLTPSQLERFTRSYSNDPAFKRFFRDIDYIATSFPPRLAQFARIFADKFNLRLIILSSHRFDLRVSSPAENELINKNLLEAHQNPQHILASSSLYESMYTKHYLNIEPEPLFDFGFHITQKIEPTNNNIVLLGPTNARVFITTRPYQAKIRHAYTQFCDDNGLTAKFAFQFIRDAYPAHYELNQLARHPAVIILPYSVFSVSSEELYDLNIPYFVPSVNFLIESGIAQDRTQSQLIGPELYKTIKTDFEDDDSPNCWSETAQRKWLSYANIYQKENAVVFDDLSDLAQKVHTIDRDGDDLRQKMYAENLKRRDYSLKLWAKTLNLSLGDING